MDLLWDKSAWDDYQFWIDSDRKVFQKINSLIKSSSKFFVLLLCGVGRQIMVIEISQFRIVVYLMANPRQDINTNIRITV